MDKPKANTVKVRTKQELADILSDEKRAIEGKAIWAEDVIIRSYLEDNNWQTLYRENSPFHHGFDFVTKHIPTKKVLIVEMKMTSNVGGLKTYLKKTKTKGRQMSNEWIVKTAEEIKNDYPLVYKEIQDSLSKGLLDRALFVTNHIKRPKGWLSASFGTMGMKGFYEKDFRSTKGFE